jgi:CheY-like chemotaxis protein
LHDINPESFEETHDDIGKSQTTRLTAVIIDDCRPDLNLQRLALQANGSFQQIVEFNSPLKALSAFVSRSVTADLILLDYRMPWMTGPEFITEYERNVSNIKPRPHIVMFSAMPAMELRNQKSKSNLLLGVYPKPITLNAIELIVEKLGIHSTD